MSTEDDIKTAERIVEAVASAVTVAAPLAGPYAPIVTLAVKGVQAIMSLVDQLGHGDAVRAALDAELASARQMTDAALANKHHDEDGS